jgi:hypothetical protein
MNTTTTTEWRELALELANVASELVTVARAGASDPGDPGEWFRGLLNNHANDVAAIVDRIREANDTPAATFDAWRDNLPAMSEHMTTPERTVEVVQWLVAVCGWDGVAAAMANHAGDLLDGSPEMLLQSGGRDALLSVLRLANHLAEATT